MHGAIGLRPNFRINFRFLGPRRCLQCHAARGAQLIGPQRHGRQRGRRVATGSNRLAQCALKGIPHHQQLRL